MSSACVPPHFQLRTEQYDDTVVVRCAGELDIACEEIFVSTLARFEERQARVVIDLSSLTFIDSTGLRLLIGAHDRSERLTIVAGNGHVMRTLELSGLHRVLPVVEERDPRDRSVPVHAA